MEVIRFGDRNRVTALIVELYSYLRLQNKTLHLDDLYLGSPSSHKTSYLITSTFATYNALLSFSIKTCQVKNCVLEFSTGYLTST